MVDVKVRFDTNLKGLNAITFEEDKATHYISDEECESLVRQIREKGGFDDERF